MFNFLKGEICSKENGLLVICVGGVGYECFVSNETMEKSANIGENDKIYTYLAVRENEVNLFGFKELEEKNLFLNLITVSGVGPKTALQILSANSVIIIISSVIKGDSGLLAKTKGIGKKTAERIVLELKEKLEKENIALEVHASASQIVKKIDSEIASDAVLALTSLGLTKAEAENAVNAEYKDGITLEELISKALRRI